ncbi:MAG: gluconeogenesis factor YvcK family protein [Candidatus Flexifilum sp.]
MRKLGLIIGTLGKWMTPGLGIKRWVILLAFGMVTTALALAVTILKASDADAIALIAEAHWLTIALMFLVGSFLVALALVRLSNAMLSPYRRHQPGRIVDVVYAHSRRSKGIKLVAIGGGTGLPSVLRGFKPFTSNITAIVTVADDGGSSGRLRRDYGVLPPGDLRNNIAALADDESLMTRLFQHRFADGDLGGHAFGNLFISALSGVTGSLEAALVETGRVLNIQGQVYPATMQDVTLAARVRIAGRGTVEIHGESEITRAGGQIERVELIPDDAEAFSGSVQAILDADVIVLGPGSLYTSILPNLLVRGIREALRATEAYKIYVCNIAMQPGETTGFTVADHVLALEQHIGRGVFQLVLANNAYPTENAGEFTRYVMPAPDHHEILQRYEVRYFDLIDTERPWRHDPVKLAQAVLQIREQERVGSVSVKPAYALI